MTDQPRLTDAARAAIEAAGKPESEVVKLTVANSGVVWERTTELRVARRISQIGRPEWLQQRWYCRENGTSEWIDIPVVDV